MDALSPSAHDIERLSDLMAIVHDRHVRPLFALHAARSANRWHEAGNSTKPTMSLVMAIGILAAATIAIVVMSEILVGALEPTAASWGLSEFFIGIMLVPLIGNIAEHLVAVQMALQNKMDLSLGNRDWVRPADRAFVTPVLVLAGWAMGTPMTLVFNRYELMGLLAAIIIAVLISVDGQSNWLEGAQLLRSIPDRYRVLLRAFGGFRDNRRAPARTLSGKRRIADRPLSALIRQAQ